MTGLIFSQISKFPANTQSLVLMSDLDEIIAEHTVRLLRACDFGPEIHLQLRDFMYRYAALVAMT
jgi:beta-1,4-mannosyl-glycoprotein beta-1,4-N-acetylglucosaminyltransferase